MKIVKIINYLAGNVFNVAKAFEYFDCKVDIISRPEEIKGADYVVFPGVGAFGEGMRVLEKQELIEPILEFIRCGKPFLGICLGMQLLFDYSEEFGYHKGLSVISGGVKKLVKQSNTKIPHIGWNSIELPEGRDRSFWQKTVLKGIPEKMDMYFVHSFAAYPDDPTAWLCRTPYGSNWFCSFVHKGNVYGCQFHPEKSGSMGLMIVNNFLSL